MKRTTVLLALFVVFSWSVRAQQHPNTAKGFNANSVYQFHQLDAVNQFNGNLTISIPIGAFYPVAAGFSYQLLLHGNANIWDAEEDDDCLQVTPAPVIAYAHRRANAGVGFVLSLGRLFPPEDPTAVGWAYESPDGADHPLRGGIPSGSCGISDATCYTRDGSYLRMTFDAVANRRKIEFPDGSIHTFKPPIGGGPWLLEKISNSFAPNFLEVKYYQPVPGNPAQEREATCAPSCGGEITKWVLRDNWGREHVVRFRQVTWDSGYRMLVESVELSAFATAISPSSCNTGVPAGTARYSFTYTDNHILHRPDWHTSGVGSCVPNTVVVSLLRTITLPDCTTFDLEYQGGAAGDAGLPAKLTLPTGGAIRWDWQQYSKPRRSADILGYQAAWGVATRKLLDRNGSTLGTWTYTSVPDCNIDPVTGPLNLCRELKATVVDPLGNRSEHFFAIEPDPPNLPEYGKPFTRKTADATGTRWLSSRTWSPNNTLLRSAYVAYEDDIPESAVPVTDFNARVESTRTVFEDDIVNNAALYLDADSSDYDGLGHYRTTSLSGTRAGAVTRVTTTNYNPGHGSHSMFAPLGVGAKWITGTFSSISTAERGFTEKSEYCFDVTGFLTRRRTLKSLDGSQSDPDLVTVFTPDSYGNVAREESYGGDAAIVSVAAAGVNWCNQPVGTPVYRIDHTHANGGVTVSNYVIAGSGQSVGFRSVDDDIDQRTGLVRTSRDGAGVVTDFVYDIMGRPSVVKPAGAAWTKYIYSPAGAAAANISVTQYPNGQTSGTALTSTSWELDGIGRAVIERQVMPDNQESRRETTYNALGWTTKVSELGRSATLPATTYTFDALGRPLSATNPDNSVGSFSYVGNRLKTRTSRVSMTPGLADVAVNVDEEYDAFGRLISVKEKSGPQGEVVTTAYTYDVASRLSSVRMSGPNDVSQNRIFDYDGRGFLRWESHAEAGMKSYTYDARGNVLTSELGAAKTPFDLKYTYDAAERLLKVEARNPDNVNTWRPIKEFTYATDNVLSPAPADYRKARLLTATRYNYKPDSGFSSPAGAMSSVVRVTETYAYRDGAGRKTHRTTVIATSPDGTCCWQEAKSVSQSVAYNDLGQESAMQYPMCFDCGTPPGAPARDLSKAYSQGRPTIVSEPWPNPTDLYKWIDGISYWPNGMRNVLTHRNAMSDTQTVDSSGMARPGELKSETFSTCKAPKVESQTLGGVRTASGAAVRLSVSVSGTGPMNYRWYDATTSTPIFGDAGAASFYDATPSAETKYYVKIWNGCREINSKTMTVKVGECVQPWFEESSATPNVNGSFTLSAAAFGTGTLTYTWKRTSDGVIVGSGISFTTPVLSSTTNYDVTVTSSCGSATRTVQAYVPIPVTPMTIGVAQEGANQLRITWGSVAGATKYTLSRRANNTGMQEYVTDLTTTQYLDQNLPVDKAYVYQVKAYEGYNIVGMSSLDLAATVAFTAVSSNDVIGAAPFNELLRAVNAVRALSGWEAVTWSNILSPGDPLPQPGAVVSSRHLLAIRSRLNEGMQAVGVAINGYTDSDPQSRLIRALHFSEIQNRLK